MLESVDSMEEVSSEGEAGGVSNVERMEAGVVDRGDRMGENLKIGEVEEGGVRGSEGWCWRGRGDGGSGAIDNTVAIVLDGDGILGGILASLSSICSVSD
jgi:hypothetical protein